MRGIWLACSICFQDPAAPTTKAVFLGMGLLVGITAFVLGIIAWTGVLWYRRSKKLEKSVAKIVGG